MNSQPVRPSQPSKQTLLYGGVAVAVLIVALIGWKLLSQPTKPKTDDSTGTSLTKVVSSGSTYNTCMTRFQDTDLCRFAATESAQPLNKTAYKATLTTTQPGANGTLAYEQDGTGNTALTTSSGSTIHLNSIQYHGTLYIQNGNVWIKYPKDSGLPQTSSPSNNLSFLSSLTSDSLTRIGSEPCGSLTCLKYKLDQPTTPGATNYVWFDTRHYLLREWNASDSTHGMTDMKINYQPVTIAAPSPVEDLSATQ